MGTIYTWLKKDNNFATVPPSESQFVLHEMIVQEIGIRANNYFTITVGFIGTVILQSIYF